MKVAQSMKQRLIEQSVQRKLKRNDRKASAGTLVTGEAAPNRRTDFRQHPGWQQLNIMREGAQKLGVEDPFFRVHEGCSGATAIIDGRECINFASYNYLGLSGDPRVIAAAQNAAAKYGTSVSASRMVSGERPIHRELEQALAQVYKADDSLAFVSGHATNVSVIGYLMGSRDLVLHDEYIHNSSLVGAQLSGARRMAFRHNDLNHLEKLLQQNRHQFERVLIVVEGLYSMDGDTPDLSGLVELKESHECWLMVDEAHALGVLGEKGLGSHEHVGIDPTRVDIWMGTLSKNLSGCGGYIAGCQPLIDMLRHFAPGFLYSVGMPASVAGAAIESLRIMQAEPQRVQALQKNSEYLANQARAAGFDVGESIGRAVVPVISGSSLVATRQSVELLKQGVNVQPILYPAVPEKSARLRFFVCSEHTEEQIDFTLDALLELGAAS
ncbi:8-amino-7-oxononanoate synthase [Marinobacterium mangrovicola]|uniref:8-amino-7-oxononanoate synthase n=2 Tax=Marinobacterium mangrovicola TaxID=1476959 RepID=A0A4R1GFP3_9GAMM|nr:aminotransferase class I/II-fold pyridoxal phosphate-dependent enzyme [Marinobacterium mangrovicola]TCK07237.1 8-amino-7-oxononanoate synthase [Marinobacterium mangrovicola]